MLWGDAVLWMGLWEEALGSEGDAELEQVGVVWQKVSLTTAKAMGEIESLPVKRKAGSGTKSEAEETRQAIWAPFFLGKCACCCCHHAWTADSGFFPPVRF